MKKPFIRGMGSLPVAVTVLLTIAGVLIYAGTIDYELALHQVYRSWWFSLLLIVLGVNLAASAALRYPWKKNHVGFVMVHAGIITILVGSLLTQWLGFEGNLMLAEGTSRDEVETDERLVGLFRAGKVIVSPPRLTWEPVWHRLDASRLKVFKPQSFRLDGQTELLVDRYYPHASRVEKFEEGDKIGGEFSPAIHFKLSNDRVTEEAWLVPDDRERDRRELGPLTVTVKRVSREELAEWKRSPVQAIGKGVLLAIWEGKSFRVPVSRWEGKTFQADGLPYKIIVRNILPHAVVEADKLVNRSKKWVNPALEIEVSASEGTERHTVFSLFPEFPTLHGHPPPLPSLSRGEGWVGVSGIKFRYEAPALEGNTLTFLTAPKEPLWAVMSSKSGQRMVSIKTGEDLVTPWMNLRLKIQAYYPVSRRIVSYQPLPVESGKEGYPEAIHVRVKKNGEEGKEGKDEGWVDLEGSAAFGSAEASTSAVVAMSATKAGGTSAAKAGWHVAFRRGRRPLGFSVKLKDFHIGKDPGTDRPASFASTVEVEDHERGRSWTQKIEMNEPLVHHGYKFFQASYVPVQPGEPEVSILAVARDPGIPLKYLGSIVLIAGIALMFYWKPGRV